jgi:probable phosphomutase (TIGR03848 family)
VESSLLSRILASSFYFREISVTILLLIRHASTDYLTAKRLAGWIPNIHLNVEGQHEADLTARRLAHVPISAIYSSPLERAIETAQAIASYQNSKIHIQKELGETHAGEWAGKLIKEVEPQLWEQLTTHASDFRFPGGESIAEMQTRTVTMSDAIVAAHPNEIVAIVSHADPLKSIVLHYLGMDLNGLYKITIDPASITIFAFGEKGPALLRLNDSADLTSFKPKPQDKSK